MKLKSHIILWLLLTAAFTGLSTACTMFKLTKHGKTLVGNNEDFWNPNTRIWFERGEHGRFGAAYVGFDNLWPQGGMNEAGLVFDGFAMPYLAIIDTTGKPEPGNDFLKDILQQYSTVEEVRDYYRTQKLTGLETSMLLYVDRSGKYLVVEGDSLILGDRPSYVLSNFYPSQVKEQSDINIPHYHKGRAILERQQDTSIAFCAAVMDSMHQAVDWGAGTMYTSLYDLNNGLIYLYYFRDYSHPVTFDLRRELAKGSHTLAMPDLFPQNTEGLAYLKDYNGVRDAVDSLASEEIITDSARYARVSQAILEKHPRLTSVFYDRMDEIGKTWMEKTRFDEAISVFSIRVRSSPESWSALNALAGAYMKIRNYQEAYKYYQESLKLNPDNEEAKRQIDWFQSKVRRRKY